LGLLDSCEFGKYVAFSLAEVLLGLKELGEVEKKGSWPLPVGLVVDVRAAFNSLRVMETKLPTEDALLVVVLQLWESLAAGRVRWVWWVDTRDVSSAGSPRAPSRRRRLWSSALRGSGRYAMQRWPMFRLGRNRDLSAWDALRGSLEEQALPGPKAHERCVRQLRSVRRGSLSLLFGTGLEACLAAGAS